jgi:hypothetical protein
MGKITKKLAERTSNVKVLSIKIFPKINSLEPPSTSSLTFVKYTGRELPMASFL